MNNQKTRIYFDTEFTGLRRDTTLISIGCISESGRYFYAELTDYNKSQCDDWIRTNVIENLQYTQNFDGSPWIQQLKMPAGVSVMMCAPRFNVAKELLKWLLNEYEYSGKQLEMVTDCYAYDWILFLDLITPTNHMNIPSYISYIPIDLSTLLWSIGEDPDVSREEFAGPVNSETLVTHYTSTKAVFAKHNAMWDALVIKACVEKIEKTDNVDH